jgi:hypothetical protein
MMDLYQQTCTASCLRSLDWQDWEPSTGGFDRPCTCLICGPGGSPAFDREASRSPTLRSYGHLEEIRRMRISNRTSFTLASTSPIIPSFCALAHAVSCLSPPIVGPRRPNSPQARCRFTTMHVFTPPKPKALLAATSIRASRAWLTTRLISLHRGSISSTPTGVELACALI